MIIRREGTQDRDEIYAVTAAAFRGVEHSAPPVDASGDPGEATLVSWLRDSEAWIPQLSLVAVDDSGKLIGHGLATRAYLDAAPALGLGPLSVDPEHQSTGVGSALMHAIVGAAEAMDEVLIGLLGSPDYYSKFGFRSASMFAVDAPDPQWGDYFQVRTLGAYDGQSGTFAYAEPFNRL